MSEIWFIAGPTNLTSKYLTFFNDNKIKANMFNGYINIFETKAITVTIDNSNIIEEILEILSYYDDLDLKPRFSSNTPKENELVCYDEYITNYYISREDGCDCNMLYQYDLLETPKLIKCFMKNNKYYGNHGIIEKRLIFTREEINKINEKHMENYNKYCRCNILLF